MSLMHALHFDSGIVPSILLLTNGGTASVTQKRTGGYSLQISPVTMHYYRVVSLPLSSAQSELYFQVALYFDTIWWINVSYSSILRWKSSGGTVLGGIRLNHTSRCLDVFTGNFATLVASGTATISQQVWNLIEVHVRIADSGIIEIRVNQLSDSTFSGDTKPGADTSIFYLDFTCVYNDSSSGAQTYFDDIVVNNPSGSANNSWPNAAKVYYLPLSGDGVTKQWTPTPAGLTHYTAIDDVPVTSTDYIRAMTTNLVDIFSVADLPSTAGSIKAVIPEVYAYKGSVESPTKLGIGIDIGSGVEYSIDKSLGINPVLVSNTWEQRPGGGSFTSSDVNALQLYLKSLP